MARIRLICGSRVGIFVSLLALPIAIRAQELDLSAKKTANNGNEDPAVATVPTQTANSESLTNEDRIKSLGYSSVREFQRTAGLQVDGILGPKTKKALQEAWDEHRQREGNAEASPPRSARERQPASAQSDAKERRIAALEEKLSKKNEILSELMEEHVDLKKSLGDL